MPDPAARLHRQRTIAVRRLPSRWRWLARGLASADVSANEWAGILSAAAAIVPLGASVAAFGMPAHGLLIALGAPAMPVVVVLRWKGRRNMRLAERLPSTLDQMVRLLRAGRTPRQAIERVAEQVHGPVSDRLQRVADGLRLGADPDRALSALCEPGDPRATARVAVVLRLALQGGAGAADAIESLAASLRSEGTAGKRVHALTAQARLSARTLTALPVVFVTFGAVTGTAQTATLIATDVGRFCAVAGAVLLAIGHVWMTALVRRIDR